METDMKFVSNALTLFIIAALGHHLAAGKAEGTRFRGPEREGIIRVNKDHILRGQGRG